MPIRLLKAGARSKATVPSPNRTLAGEYLVRESYARVFRHIQFELGKIRYFFYYRSWPNASGSSQKVHLHTSHHLLRHPSYACESSCLLLRLPPRRDTAVKPDAAVLLVADCFCSLSPRLQTFGRSGLSCYRNVCQVLLQILVIFPLL